MKKEKNQATIGNVDYKKYLENDPQKTPVKWYTKKSKY